MRWNLFFAPFLVFGSQADEKRKNLFSIHIKKNRLLVWVIIFNLNSVTVFFAPSCIHRTHTHTPSLISGNILEMERWLQKRTPHIHYKINSSKTESWQTCLIYTTAIGISSRASNTKVGVQRRKNVAIGSMKWIFFFTLQTFSMFELIQRSRFLYSFFLNLWINWSFPFVLFSSSADT